MNHKSFPPGPESRYNRNSPQRHLVMFGFLSGDRIPDRIGVECSVGLMKTNGASPFPRFAWGTREQTESFYFGLPLQQMLADWTESSDSQTTIRKTSILVGRLDGFLDWFSSNKIALFEGRQLKEMVARIIEKEREKLCRLAGKDDGELAAQAARINTIKSVCLGIVHDEHEPLLLNRSLKGAIIVPSRFARVPELAAILELSLYLSSARKPIFLITAYDFGGGVKMDEAGAQHRIEYLVYGNQLALSMKEIGK